MKYKKQTILAQSKMEAKVIALASINEEEGWLKNLLSDTILWEKPITIVLIHYNSTLSIAKVPNQHYNGKRGQIGHKT